MSVSIASRYSSARSRSTCEPLHVAYIVDADDHTFLTLMISFTACTILGRFNLVDVRKAQAARQLTPPWDLIARNIPFLDDPEVSSYVAEIGAKK